jgi:hypothetical protein
MLEYLPESATLRRIADRMNWLFRPPEDSHQASSSPAAIVRDPTFQAVLELPRRWSNWSGEFSQAYGPLEQPN